MKYTIEVRPKAFADIRRVVERITLFISAKSAASWQAGVFAKIDSLSEMPHRYPLADEGEAFQKELRMALYRRARQVYRILFTVVDDKVVVHRVRHAAQDWLKEDEL